MSEERLYSVDEANALLPHLAPTLVELREKFEQAAAIREQLATAAASNGGAPEQEDWSDVLARVSELIERVQDWGIQLRDVATGLVDFPGIVEGEEAWLCWRLGEAEVAYWHRRDEGFDGRRPLS